MPIVFVPVDFPRDYVQPMCRGRLRRGGADEGVGPARQTPRGIDLQGRALEGRRPKVPRRQDREHLGPEGPKEHYLRRRRIGKPLEERQQRHNLEADLRRPVDVLRFRGHGLRQGPQSGMGGHRRTAHGPKFIRRNRRVQVHRRRRNLAAQGACRHAAHRPGAYRPEGFERRLRSRLGMPVPLQRRAGSLQDGRRRQDLEESSLHIRKGRRGGSRHGPLG